MAAERVVVSEAAKEDLARQSQWYISVAGERVARRYLEAFQSVMSVLAQLPAGGVPRKFRDPRLQGLRSVFMPGAFRVHLVFYRMEEDEVVVFRVLHGMRDLPRRLAE